MEGFITVEDVLVLMAFGLHMLVAPGRHLNGPAYEQWLEQHGWRRRLELLRQQGALERSRQGTKWVYRLTTTGRTQVHGARDPEVMWGRRWDGWWRQILFDLPVQPGHVRARAKLLRWLRRENFGYLQDSVWIRPDPIPELSSVLHQLGSDASLVAVLESRCIAGSSNATLVKAAWSFDEVDRAYHRYEDFAEGAQKRLRHEKIHPRNLFALLRCERELWNSAFARDPLLPRSLWPVNYRGPSTWRTRCALIRELARRIKALCG